MFPVFQSLLSEVSKSYQTISITKQLHALIAKTQLSSDPFYVTKILRFYALNHQLCSARNLFDTTPHRSVFLWNSIIRAYAQAYKFDDAITLFLQMLRTVTKPDNFTYACVIRACSENFDLDVLRIVHGGAIISRFGLDSICGSALVTAYSKLGLVGEASKIFNGIPEPDLVLWNSMISGYGYCGLWDKGLLFFNWLRGVGIKPDGYTLIGLIMGLTDNSLLNVGHGVHGFCVKNNFDSNPHIGSALVSMYSRCKCMDSAYIVFSSIFQPDLVTWSALVTGYLQCGQNEKVLLFFKKLNMNGKKADSILIASVLAASAQFANIRPAKEIHGYVLRQGLESNILVSSALVNTYSKCGFVGLAIHVFKNMPNRTTISYNSIILGLSLHGLASQAFGIFSEMLEMGVRPDESTFSALLSACCHAGLVHDGREVFRRMIEEFYIQARSEHYVHMVKLLGMAGELEQAYEFIISLPKPVDSGIWGALLSCCDFHQNTELAELVAKQLFESEPKKGAYRVMLSNIYAGSGKWDEVKKLRDGISENGVTKLPGLSLIECDGG